MKHLLLFALCLLITACGNSTTNPDPVNERVEADNPVVDDEDPGIVEEEDDPVVPPGSAQLAVLSNRPDLISGGDVLVEVVLGDAGDRPQLQLTRNGDDVTGVLQATPDNARRLLGVVDELDIGENTLAVNLGNSVVVTNHPIEGPVFTGPHIQPWQCQGSAVDEFCNQDVAYSLLYLSTTPNSDECPEETCPGHSPGLRNYDPENPPGDVAMTTTDNGETLPFIVRREQGYLARDQYAIYTLFKEGEPWTAANPQSQWNGRLLVTHGGNCRGDHNTDEPQVQDYAGTIPPNPGIANSYITGLGNGWSVLSTAQLNLGHNCNVSYQAESLMMAKERYVEQYGELRYTVGTGCSGGAISQNMIANAYPGLYNGLLTTCTYPDVMSTATQFADYHILLRYFGFRTSEPDGAEDFTAVFMARDGTNFNVAQQNAIYGHRNGVVNASLADDQLFSEAVDPRSNCGGIPGTVEDDPDTRYHPTDNPEGVRCDVLTFMKNMVGARQEDRWGDAENEIGEGFAGFPLGNEGVQYGLEPLRAGVITPAQFVALNTNIGAVDTDLNLTAERLRPDSPALPNAYRSGILNTVVNMDTVPIINMTGPDPGIAHDSIHGYWMRYRFEREFPEVSREQSNFVMWGGPAPLIGDPNYMNQSLLAMADWLDAIEADTSSASLAQKILDNKPASVTDQCSNGSGETVRNEMCTEEEMAVYETPRLQAGALSEGYIEGDMVQCHLRAFSRNDDYGAGNTVWNLEPDAASWQALEATFATGVCDYSQRPIGWTETITWLDYQDELDEIVTGGEQMDEAPYPRGWASPAFSGAWAPGFARGE